MLTACIGPGCPTPALCRRGRALAEDRVFRARCCIAPRVGRWVRRASGKEGAAQRTDERPGDERPSAKMGVSTRISVSHAGGPVVSKKPIAEPQSGKGCTPDHGIFF